MKPYKLFFVCLAIGVLVLAVLRAMPRASLLSTTTDDVEQVLIEQNPTAQQDGAISESTELAVQEDVRSDRRTMDYEDDWCRLNQLNAAGRAKYLLEDDKWRKSIGYFSNDDRLVYATYDDDALRQLGNQGDLLALDTLFERLIESRETATGAYEALYTAAAFGSTKAAISLATVHRLKMRRMPDGLPENEDLYRIMAFYEIAAIGGDLYGVRKGRNFLRGLRRELSADERAIVAGLALEIREDLRRERQISAIPPVETETSKAVIRYRKYQYDKYFSNPDYVGWGSQYISREGECKDAAMSAKDDGRS